MALSPKTSRFSEEFGETSPCDFGRGRRNTAPLTEDCAVIASFQDRIGDIDAGTLSYSVPASAELIAEGIAGCDLYICRDMAAAAEIWSSFQVTAEMTPFQRHEWLDRWLERLPARNKVAPLIALVFERGQIRLIAPLAIETGVIARRLVWLGQKVNDYNAPLVDTDWLTRLRPDAARQIWRRITHCDHGADYVHLTRQPAYLGTCRNPFIDADAAPYSCDSHFLTLSRDWQQLYGNLRSAKSRRRLREKVRRLKKSGPIGFRRIRGRDAVVTMIATLLEWKQEQLNRRGSRNPFTDGQIGEQLVSMATDPRTSGMVRVYSLEVNGHAVAATVALAQGGVFNFYVCAYNDAGHRNSSPGTIMLVKLIELASRAGFAKFDFSMGDEPYKAEWCNGLLAISHQTEPLTILGLPCAVLARLSIAAKRGIKANEPLFTALQTVNARRTALIRGFGTSARA